MKNFQFQVNGCIICCDCGNRPLEAGDRVNLDLDNSAITGLPDKIIATVLSAVQHSILGIAGYTYVFEYDEADLLPSPLTELRPCDIVGVPTCRTCCDELHKRIDELVYPSITNNAAPFSVVGPVTNIPAVSAAVAGNSLTVTVGGQPVVFTPAGVSTGPSSDAGNLLTAGADGLSYVNCAALMACLDNSVASVTFNSTTKILTIIEDSGTMHSATIPDANTEIATVSFNPANRTLTIVENDGSVFTAVVPHSGASSDPSNIVQNGTDGRAFVSCADILACVGGTISNLTFNNGTRILTLTDSSGASFSVTIPDIHLVSSAFNPTTRVLTLTDNTGASTTVVIPGQASGPSADAGNLIGVGTDNLVYLNCAAIAACVGGASITSLTFNPTTRVLTLVDGGGTTFNVTIPDVRIVSSVYNAGTSVLTLTDNTGATFNTTIVASGGISADPGNALTVGTDSKPYQARFTEVTRFLAASQATPGSGVGAFTPMTVNFDVTTVPGYDPKFKVVWMQIYNFSDTITKSWDLIASVNGRERSRVRTPHQTPPNSSTDTNTFPVAIPSNGILLLETAQFINAPGSTNTSGTQFYVDAFS